MTRTSGRRHPLELLSDWNVKRDLEHPEPVQHPSQTRSVQHHKEACRSSSSSDDQDRQKAAKPRPTAPLDNGFNNCQYILITNVIFLCYIQLYYKNYFKYLFTEPTAISYADTNC